MAFILLNTKYILHSNPHIFDLLTSTCYIDVQIQKIMMESKIQIQRGNTYVNFIKPSATETLISSPQTQSINFIFFCMFSKPKLSSNLSRSRFRYRCNPRPRPGISAQHSIPVQQSGIQQDIGSGILDGKNAMVLGHAEEKKLILHAGLVFKCHLPYCLLSL